MNSFWISTINHFFAIDYVSVNVPGEYSYNPNIDISRRVKSFPSGEKYIRYAKQNYIFSADMTTLYSSQGKNTGFKPLTWRIENVQQKTG